MRPVMDDELTLDSVGHSIGDTQRFFRQRKRHVLNLHGQDMR